MLKAVFPTPFPVRRVVGGRWVGGVGGLSYPFYRTTPTPLGCALLASCCLLGGQILAGSGSCGWYILSRDGVVAETGSLFGAGTVWKNRRNLNLATLWSFQARKAGRRILEAE